MNLLIGKAVRTLEKASSYADVKEDQIKAIQREHYWNWLQDVFDVNRVPNMNMI